MKNCWNVFLTFSVNILTIKATPVSSPSWEELIPTNGIKFSGRNAHASCVFKGEIWLVGGRTDLHTKYNLEDSYQMADVWHSQTGALWDQEEELTGDFFAQNQDVTQPGPIAPWYERYGHSLNALDITGDGDPDIMLMAGGYTPSPSNDVWISENGKHWIYAGLQPWSPRAWHSTVIFQGKLWIMGGTPLNNEVWLLDRVTRVSRFEPSTRSLFSNYTFELEWKRFPNAPWSPRVGAGVVSQWFYNATSGETLEDSRERIVLAGGYGGWPNNPETIELYDGYVSRPDTWHSYDGLNWTQLNWNNTFQGRAWFGMEVLHMEDPRIDNYVNNTNNDPPKMFIFGGGFIGSLSNSKRRVTSMEGKADGYWSRDGIYWFKINYEEGGGRTSIPFFSSQEWSETIVDTDTKYLGRWGLTLHSFDGRTGQTHPGRLVLLAGDFTGGGEMASSVYRSLTGIICDIDGIICSGRGRCVEEAGGCICDVIDGNIYGGERCEIVVSIAPSAAPLVANARNGIFLFLSLWTIRNLITYVYSRY